MNTKNLLRIVEQLEDLIEPLHNERLNVLGKFLTQRIANPESYVVLLGETSSGKSTVINGIIRKEVLPISAIPTTGAITEVYFENKDSRMIEYYAINKDATMEVLDEEAFSFLAKSPDQDISRLRIVVPANSTEMQGLRLFDTPGYGSIINEHEEVLRDFLPNADVIVYVVSYKSGFQQYDYEFLCSLSSMFSEDMPFVLVINRCPKTITSRDRRIKEIKEYVTSILKKPNMPIIILQLLKFSEFVDDSEIHHLGDEITTIINAPERELLIQKSFRKYISDYVKLIELEFCKYSRTAEEVESIKKANEQLCRDFDKVIPEIIEPGFKEIENKIPIFIKKSSQRIKMQLINEIETSDTLKMEEMKAYIQIHKLPFLNQQESKELQYNLQVMLLELDQKVRNYLNTALIHYESKITVNSDSSAFEQTGKKIAKGKITELASNGLLDYFTQLGGAGKAGAGIANAASHGLKQLGDLLGHTFSKGTHNQLKQFLSKIGATSSKIVGPAVAVFVEVIDIGYDYYTWKDKLKDKIYEALDKWQTQANEVIIKDLNELKEENIKTILGLKEGIKEDAKDVPKNIFTTEQLNKMKQVLDKVKGEVV